MAKFVCKHCNYRYESDLDQADKACPYCDKKEIIKQPDADDLIREG